MNWCTVHDVEPGAIVPLEQVWELSKAWYADRLRPGFRGRTIDEAVAALRHAGLTGPFWEPE